MASWIRVPLLWCLAWSSRRLAREVGLHSRSSDRWCWWLRNAALSYEMPRQVDGTVEADDLSHTASQKGQAQHGGQKPLGRRARGRRKQRELGQGHDDKDRPAMIAWGSRHGAVGIQATTDCPVKTVQKAADRAVHAGRRLSTDVASSDRAVQGSGHEFVNQPPKASARGDVQDNRAACLFSWRKPSLRVCRGVSTCNLAGDVGFFQCLRHLRQHHACEKAKLILQAT